MNDRHEIRKAFNCATKRNAEETALVLHRYRRARFCFAVYALESGYCCVREKYGPTLFDYALEHGYEDPRFLGFYGGGDGWQCFADDVGLIVEVSV